MCLYVDCPKLKIADRDIICYKVVLGNRYSSRLRAPFIRFRYRIGKLYENTAEINANYINHSIMRDSFGINAGVYHSYLHKKHAENLAQYLYNCAKHTRVLRKLANTIVYAGGRAFYTFHIATCVIPKGSEYLEGTDGTNAHSYGSRKLMVTNIKEYVPTH